MPVPDETYGYEPQRCKPAEASHWTPYLSEAQLLAFGDTDAFEEICERAAEGALSDYGFWKACLAAAFAQGMSAREGEKSRSEVGFALNPGPVRAGGAQRETYTFTNGWSMQREIERPSRWLLRDQNDELVDRDKYRHDLIERFRLKVESHFDPVAQAIEARSGQTEGLDPKGESAVTK